MSEASENNPMKNDAVIDTTLSIEDEKVGGTEASEPSEAAFANEATQAGRAALPSEDTKQPDMPWFIPNDDERGVYRFILASAKRARQLQAGARPTISTTSRKPTRIAMEELRQGAVGVELIELEESEEALAASKLMDQPVRATAPPPEPLEDLLNSDS